MQRIERAAVAERDLTADRAVVGVRGQRDGAERERVAQYAAMTRTLFVLLASCGCPSGRHDVDIVASQSQFKFQIDTCFADDRACDELCRAALGLGTDVAIERCTIESATDTDVTVRAIYVEPSNCS